MVSNSLMFLTKNSTIAHVHKRKMLTVLGTIYPLFGYIAILNDYSSWITWTVEGNRFRFAESEDDLKYFISLIHVWQ